MTETRSILVLTNQVHELRRSQTTFLFADAAAARGHRVVFSQLTGLFATNPAMIKIRGQLLRNAPTPMPSFSEAATFNLEDFDEIWPRFNPGRIEGSRDAFDTWFEMLERLPPSVKIKNELSGIKKWASKLNLIYLPEDICPLTVFAQDHLQVPPLLDVFHERKEATLVVKPCYGTRGANVQKVSILEIAKYPEKFVRGPTIIQALIPGPNEDLRILISRGQILKSEDGRALGIHRIARAGEFRANVVFCDSIGPGQLTQDATKRLAPLAQSLWRDGIHYAALDTRGGKVVEVNVQSPGGLYYIQKFWEPSSSSTLTDNWLIH